MFEEERDHPKITRVLRLNSMKGNMHFVMKIFIYKLFLFRNRKCITFAPNCIVDKTHFLSLPKNLYIEFG